MPAKHVFYAATGKNGEYFEFDDGTYVDTVAGDGYYTNGTIVPDTSDVKALCDWACKQGFVPMSSPVVGEFSEDEMAEYVGAQ